MLVLPLGEENKGSWNGVFRPTTDVEIDNGASDDVDVVGRLIRFVGLDSAVVADEEDSVASRLRLMPSFP